MKTVIYKDGVPTGEIDVPHEIANAAMLVRNWLGAQIIGTSIYGLGNAYQLQRQLAEVTRERDTLRAMLDLQNDKLERATARLGKDKPC